MPWPVEAVETFPVPVAIGPLRAALARPRDARTAGTVLLLEGRGEFLEKYGPTVVRLVARGFVVLGFDWRGQGASPRLVPGSARGHVRRFEDYLEDLACVAARAEALGLPRPWYLLAHSMGAHLALRWLVEDCRRAERAALVAPMFDIDFRPLPRNVVEPIVKTAVLLGAEYRYAPGQRDPRSRCRFESNPATSCPEGFVLWRRLLESHPERRVGGVTWGWLAAALRSIEALRAPGVLERVSVPLLIFCGEADRVVCNRATVSAARRLRSARLVAFPNARHDLFFERPSVRETLHERILAFFSESSEQHETNARPAELSRLRR